MADIEGVDVPAKQKVESVLKTIVNESFAQKAEVLKPRLHKSIGSPLSVIEFQPDPAAFFKCKSLQTHAIEELSTLSYGKGDQVILDPGPHRVGYLSFHVGVEGVNVDAPARLRLTFGEIPYDVTESLHPCET
jgi:alpha-L-rhamnosidase